MTASILDRYLSWMSRAARLGILETVLTVDINAINQEQRLLLIAESS